MITITEIERVREDAPRRTPLAKAAQNLCRLKTEQLARELAAKQDAARATTAWDGAEEMQEVAHG